MRIDSEAFSDKRRVILPFHFRINADHEILKMIINPCYTVGTSGKAALIKSISRRLENEDQNVSINLNFYFYYTAY